jgi:hypothetical protein
MSDTHVIAALRAKRLEIAAHVHDTEKKLAKLRSSLANLDAAMNLLTPGHPRRNPAPEELQAHPVLYPQ